MITRPLIVFFVYISVIFIYSLLYYNIPNTVNVEDFSLLKSIYFSTVIITTLGFGDIAPKSNLGMILVSTEAILGIVIIGLFLNSIWHKFIENVEKLQNESVKKGLAEQNLQGISSYYKFLNVIIKDYKISIYELTTPIADRKNDLSINKSFKFSDLQDIYKKSVLMKSGFSKSTIRIFFEKQDHLIGELKFLISNFDLSLYSELHQAIINFLTLSKSQDIREALFSHETTKAGDKYLSLMIESMIKEHEKCPDILEYKSNVIMPVILLYQTVNFQILYVNIIDKNLHEITNTQNHTTALYTSS